MKPKNPLIILLTAIVSIGIGGISILQLLQTEVVLVDGNSEEKFITFSKNVKSFIESQSLKLKPLDEVYPPEDTKLREGLRIVVHRFKPIRITVNEKVIEIYERNLTTAEVLRKAGVTIGGTDQVSVSMDRVIKSGEQIVVSKEEKIVILVDREVPFKNTTVKTNNLDPGERQIEQYGVMGKMRDYYEITKRGGMEVSRALIRTETVSEPVEQIMQVGPAYVKKTTTQLAIAQTGSGSSSSSGTGANLIVSRSKNFSYKTSYIMIATAYDLSFASTGKNPGMPGYGITASGTQARVGAVAVDPTVIPLGTKLYIENADGSGSYGYATAEDTGSAIKGYRVDLFFNTYQECINFGRKRVIVYVLE